MADASPQKREMLISEIWSIIRTRQGSAILLKPRSKDLAVPIFIGALEMQSILIGKEGKRLSRPLTHDLFLDMLSRVNLSIRRIEVYELKNDIFHARLIITGGEYTNEKPLILDSRPSDAFAVATRKKCPIFIATSVIEQTGIPLDYFVNAWMPDSGLDDLPGENHTDFGSRSLKAQLEQAVAEEEYEQAAEIRDMIRKLESEAEPSN